MASTGRLGWFILGIILGAIIQGIYTGLVVFIASTGFTSSWFAGALTVVFFLSRLVAWFGLMLAVAASLGSRIIRQDKMNYALIGFGAIIVTLELFSFIQFIQFRFA